MPPKFAANHADFLVELRALELGQDLFKFVGTDLKSAKAIEDDTFPGKEAMPFHLGKMRALIDSTVIDVSAIDIDISWKAKKDEWWMDDAGGLLFLQELRKALGSGRKLRPGEYSVAQGKGQLLTATDVDEATGLADYTAWTAAVTTGNLAMVQHLMDKPANKLLKRAALDFEANQGVKVSEDEPQRGKLNAVLVEYVALRGAAVKLTLPGRAQWPVQVESQHLWRASPRMRVPPMQLTMRKCWMRYRSS